MYITYGKNISLLGLFIHHQAVQSANVFRIFTRLFLTLNYAILIFTNKQIFQIAKCKWNVPRVIDFSLNNARQWCNNNYNPYELATKTRCDFLDLSENTYDVYENFEVYQTHESSEIISM